MSEIFPGLFHQFCFEGISQSKQMKAFKHISISSIDFEKLTYFNYLPSCQIVLTFILEALNRFCAFSDLSCSTRV